ncbi:MAG: hypothetical protein U9P42_02850 [Candidatus Fermentibacteria bacterium]|nr:hypothetical protein [Candidatus Fermentibacteria bacterium]
MKTLIFLSLVAMIALVAGCGDSATEIIGTLPVVTEVTVDTLASKGDTIVITWTAMDTTLVDGYFLWTRQMIEGPWSLVETCDNNVGVHIANGSGYYSVMAFQGTDTSSDISISANTKTDGISEIRELFALKPVGFRIDMEGDSLIAGDPALLEFSQQFVVAINWLGERHIFPGNANPDLWPGGARTRISSRGGFVAPAPEDTLLWNDSISYGGDFFLALDNGHYCMLKGSSTLPDTATMTDTLVLRGQIQPLMGVRVFNQQ